MVRHLGRVGTPFGLLTRLSRASVSSLPASAGRVDGIAETRRAQLSNTSHLALIHAGCQADEGIVFLDHDGLTGPISQEALDAAWALAPLRHLPGTIANWRPAATRGGTR